MKIRGRTGKDVGGRTRNSKRGKERRGYRREGKKDVMRYRIKEKDDI